MKILVTGGAGFIGSNFILKYIDRHQIINYDKLTYAGNINNLSSIKGSSNYTFIKGSINDSKLFIETLNKYKPNVILNFAAESHVDRSIDGPKTFIETNILGTFEILNASLDYYNNLGNIDKEDFKFLHVSTDEVYGSLGTSNKFKETTPYKPSSPYSASKASSDHLVNSWHKTFKLPILITNCSNNYGPYQFPEKLIPLVITNCLQNKKIPIYGNGQNVRDWIYVDDHCKALYKVLEDGIIGETYNIGGNQEVKNIDIVKNICNILDKEKPLGDCKSYIDLITFVKDRPGHDFRYAIDSSKIEDKLGYHPKYNIKTGLKKTIDWYLNNIEWIDQIRIQKYNQKRLGVI
tara:strand:- start:4592 stop:5638 length:1047 start_codon:yes stop_codon:yes gene_type:complete